ncbi:hypothetical protein MAR_000376 [Mya arenaria]|uniref:Uncharacterized protein n=1 Tax=Mya arenaria TaxID=6604 RepID=A0ABY7F8M9_MYAAR|nr:hypothetical protein MAR_000376 [Mya arenaria]
MEIERTFSFYKEVQGVVFLLDYEIISINGPRFDYSRDVYFCYTLFREPKSPSGEKILLSVTNVTETPDLKLSYCTFVGSSGTDVCCYQTTVDGSEHGNIPVVSDLVIHCCYGGDDIHIFVTNELNEVCVTELVYLKCSTIYRGECELGGDCAIGSAPEKLLLSSIPCSFEYTVSGSLIVPDVSEVPETHSPCI